ncbi:ANTAR domain-containing protein [Geodermatophilus marinus]|uniref:ANTAR domain-containing protein n=1 Tax=Geodermatophilus sp. LHW52908 TaxID=2303986 RepID=UPI001F343FDA|nr:ANTAR domain-containing protein [Geodermatophilus sp. LHW52908]
MERYEVTADDAVRLLVAASSQTDRELVDIADELCATGAMPDRGRHGRGGP